MTLDSTGDRPPTLDDVLLALANARRRLVLQELYRAPGGIGFDRLALTVTARETHRRGRNVDLETVRVALHHVHLPALQAADLATVDGDVVRPRWPGAVEAAVHRLRNQLSPAPNAGGWVGDDPANA